jgi:hypothetical protein
MAVGCLPSDAPGPALGFETVIGSARAFGEGAATHGLSASSGPLAPDRPSSATQLDRDRFARSRSRAGAAAPELSQRTLEG